MLGPCSRVMLLAFVPIVDVRVVVKIIALRERNLGSLSGAERGGADGRTKTISRAASQHRFGGRETRSRELRPTTTD